MEFFVYIEFFLVNKEIKDLKFIEKFNWKKFFNLIYINFLLVVIVNFILINDSLVQVLDIFIFKINSYSDFNISRI